MRPEKSVYLRRSLLRPGSNAAKRVNLDVHDGQDVCLTVVGWSLIEMKMEIADDCCCPLVANYLFDRVVALLIKRPFFPKWFVFEVRNHDETCII